MLVGALLGVLIALIGIALVWIVLARDPTAPLTEAAFEAARARWEQNGPKSYDMDVQIAGNRPGPVHIEVRDGEVTHMTRDGIEPKQRRTWEYWSVPGMFDTIERELEMAANGPGGAPDPPGARRELRARFDFQFGYPTRFQRTVSGAHEEVDWTVTAFIALPTSAGKAEVMKKN